MFSFRSKKARAIEFQLALAHGVSAYRSMPLNVFAREVHKLVAGQDCEIDFDERFYLEANPDVKDAVTAGGYLCGYVHFCLSGQNEARLWSTYHSRRTFGVPPLLGQGLFAPTNFHAPAVYGPDLSALPPAAQDTLLVLVPNLLQDLFFAGYSEFFNDLRSIFPIFARIIVVVASTDLNPELVTCYDTRIEVIQLSSIGQLTEKPSVVINFDFETFHIANEIFNSPERTIYYCQDFEAGFFSYGTNYVRAERAVAHSRNIVLSTGLLKNFLAQRGLLSGANIHVTSPTVKAITIEAGKKKRLFFYFRPEHFNTRNMPELVMAAVEGFCRKKNEYEIILCGTVKTSYSIRVHETDVTVLSKLSREKYEAILASSDAVVALIYSAHPGVIAFQAAASGIPTVTNTFENRDAKTLRSISKNIIPFDPVHDDLLDKLEEALSLPRGNASFDAALYEGRSNESFAQYIINILRDTKKSTPNGRLT
jgi:hypothetical protein